MKAFNISNSCFDLSSKYKRHSKPPPSTKHFPEPPSQTPFSETFHSNNPFSYLNHSLSSTKAGSTLPFPNLQSTITNLHRFTTKTPLPSISKSMYKTHRQPNIISLKYTGYSINNDITNDNLSSFRNVRHIKKITLYPQTIRENVQSKSKTMPEENHYGHKLVDMLYNSINSSRQSDINNEREKMLMTIERMKMKIGNDAKKKMMCCLFEHVIDNVIEHCVEYRSRNNEVISRNMIEEFYEEEIHKIKNEMYLNEAFTAEKDNMHVTATITTKEGGNRKKRSSTKDDISSIKENPSELETSYDRIMISNMLNEKITMNDIDYIRNKIKGNGFGFYNSNSVCNGSCTGKNKIIIPKCYYDNVTNKDKQILMYDILFGNKNNITNSTITQHDTIIKPKSIKNFNCINSKTEQRFVPQSERNNNKTVLYNNDNNYNNNTTTQFTTNKPYFLNKQAQGYQTPRNIQEQSASIDNNETTFKEFQANSNNNSNNNINSRKIHNNNRLAYFGSGGSGVFGVSSQNDLSTTKEETNVTNHNGSHIKKLKVRKSKNVSKTAGDKNMNARNKSENGSGVIKSKNNSGVESMKTNRKISHRHSSSTQNDINVNSNGITIQQERKSCVPNSDIKTTIHNGDETNSHLNIHKNNSKNSKRTTKHAHSNLHKHKQSAHQFPQTQPLQFRHFKTSYFPFLHKNPFLKQNTYQSHFFPISVLSFSNLPPRSNSAKPPHKHKIKQKKLRLGLLTLPSFINDYLIYSSSSPSSHSNTTPLSSFFSEENEPTLFQHTNKMSSDQNEYGRLQIKFVSPQRKHAKGFFNMKQKSRFVNYRKKSYYGNKGREESLAVMYNKRVMQRIKGKGIENGGGGNEGGEKDQGECVSQLQRFIDIINQAKNQGDECYIKELTKYFDGEFMKTNAYTTKLHENRINKFKFDFNQNLNMKQEVTKTMAKGFQFKDVTTFQSKQV